MRLVPNSGRREKFCLPSPASYAPQENAMKTNKWLLFAIAAITCGALFAATGDAPSIHRSGDDRFPGRGVWTGEVESSGIHINARWESRGESGGEHWSSGSIGRTYPVTMFSGVDAEAFMKMDDTPAKFQINGEAGTVSFSGTFRGGEGAGHFAFTPNRAFGDAVKALGVSFDAAEDLSDRHLFEYTLNGLTTQYIRDLQGIGYRENLDTYGSMSLFGVTPALIRELAGLGYNKIPAEDLVAMRIHKVTPDYIRAMKAAGFDHLDVDDLVTSRIHKATPEFAAEMKAAGYPGLKMDDLVTFRIHGVSAAFVQALRAQGYEKLAADDLVTFRIHRVTPELIRDLRALGYDHLDADDLVTFRIHGVSPEFIKELREAGYDHVPADKLVEMRIHGIDGAYIRKMAGKKR
jgi:hypothetical protein